MKETKEELQKDLAAYRFANEHGGNWETHYAEVVVEERLKKLMGPSIQVPNFD
jgi:hypothetical protein